MMAQYLIKLIRNGLWINFEVTKEKVSIRKYIFATCNYKCEDLRIQMWTLLNKIRKAE